jgi:hypothetical protein
MFNRRSRFLIAVASVLALPATAFAIVPTQGVSVSVPGLRGIQALEVCTQVGATPKCTKVATPKLRSGRVSVRWERSLRSGVTATPLKASSAQCHGRPGTGIRAATSDIATDLTMSVQATYAGVSSPKTVVSVRRTLEADQGAAIWFCLL